MNSEELFFIHAIENGVTIFYPNDLSLVQRKFLFKMQELTDVGQGGSYIMTIKVGHCVLEYASMYGEDTILSDPGACTPYSYRRRQGPEQSESWRY